VAANPFRESDLPSGVREQIERAAAQAGAVANEPPRDQLPNETQGMRVWALSQVKHYVAHYNPFENEELALMIAEQDRKQHPFGDLPLIVLSRGTPAHIGESQWIEDERVAGQAALAKISSRPRSVRCWQQREDEHPAREQPDIGTPTPYTPSRRRAGHRARALPHRLIPGVHL
jgi:hypothetical protein